MATYEDLEKNTAPNLAADFLPITSVLGSSMSAVATGLILPNDHSLMEEASDEFRAGQDQSNQYSF